MQVFLIVITFPKLWWFVIQGTYFFGFIYLDLIHNIVNNSVVFLFFLGYFPRYRVSPMVLSRPIWSILSPQYPQDLMLIRIMSNTVDHTDFWFTIRVIYKLFTALASAPIRRQVSVLRGGFSSLFPNESSTVGFFPDGFFISRCYHTFINTFGNLH